MVNYETKAPGVYFEEISPAGPIAGRRHQHRGADRQPRRPNPAQAAGKASAVTNWTAYTRRVRRLRHDRRRSSPTRSAASSRTAGRSGLHRAAQGRHDKDGVTAALARCSPGSRDVSLVCLPGIVDGATARSW